MTSTVIFVTFLPLNQKMSKVLLAQNTILIPDVVNENYHDFEQKYSWDNNWFTCDTAAHIDDR